MRATTFCIHGCLPDFTIFLSSFQQLQTIDIVSDLELSQTLYKYALEFGLMDVEGLGIWIILS